MTDQNSSEESSRPNLRFTVMPDLEGIGKIPVSPPPVVGMPPPATIQRPSKMPSPPSLSSTPAVSPTQPGISSGGGLTDQVRERRQLAESGDPGNSGVRRKVLIVLVIFVILGLTGAAAAFLWEKNRSQGEAKCEEGAKCDNASQAEPAQEVIESPAPEEEAIPKDTDFDGLTDTEEQERGTDLNDPDTDGDGLADGDEVKIFNTSAFSPHSDDDGFSDSKEIKDGYSPLLGGDAKLSEAEIQKITQAAALGRLHEPTFSTLDTANFWKGKLILSQNGSGSSPAASTNQFAYQDVNFGYQLILPGEWKKTEASKENVTFIEKDSKLARYVQVQVVSIPNLLESEIKRAGQAATSEVRYKQSQIAGNLAYRFSYDLERQPASPSGSVLKSSVIEYIVFRASNNFVITVGCTTDGDNGCLTAAEAMALALEKDMRL